MSKEPQDSGNNIPNGPETSGERARLGIGQEPAPGGAITDALSPDQLPAATGKP
jgi:hypothetical protein